MGKNQNPRFRDVSYHGGFNDFSKNHKRGNLWFNDDTIGIGLRGPKHPCVTTSSVVRVVLGTEAGGVHSVLPGMTSGGNDRTPIEIHTNDGQVGQFTINQSPAKVRGGLCAWLREKNIAEGVDNPVASASSTSVADEIVKLASLRDSGLLTEEQFEAQKAKLLD
jgi:hypothetical protein